MNRSPEPLRPYQEIGANFLAGRRHALLGDVPRIGKTAQAIRACDLIQAKRILILCPGIARLQWESEFQKFSSRGLTWDVVLTSNDPCAISDGTICSYDLATTSGVSTKLLATRWDCVIADEAHMLKNIESQRASFFWKQLVHRSDRVWLLTGSPAKNHAGELWPALRSFGACRLSYDAFVARYLDTQATPYGLKILGNNPFTLDELRAMVGTIMLRRTLEDVLTELPDIQFTDMLVEPAPVNMRRWFPDILMRDQTEEQVKTQIGSELYAMESWLDLVDEGLHTIPSPKLMQGITALQGPKTDKSRRYVGLQKSPSVAKVVSTELEAGEYEKIVLFAWHRDVITCLREELRDWHPETLYGGMTLKNQMHAKSEFTKKPKCRVLICNYLTAGVAIDLSITNHVGFVEPSYVPEDNAQAAMRVYRFGQTRPVFARFFNLAHSVDDRINRILRRKTKSLVELFGKPAKPEPQEDYNPFAD